MDILDILKKNKEYNEGKKNKTANDAQKSADNAKKSAKEAQDATDKAIDSGDKDADKKQNAADKANEYAKNAQDAADKAAEAKDKGDKEGEEKAAKEAQDAEKKAKNAAAEATGEKIKEKYPKRPEYFVKHYRILAKHNNKIKIFKKSSIVRNFFYNTVGIESQNTYIGFLDDKLNHFKDENIIWIDGKYFSNILEVLNKEFIRIDENKLFHTTDELKLDADEIGRIVSEYMNSSNIIRSVKERIKNLIENFYAGNNSEFYIIMNPKLDENTKYTADGKIIIPDKNVLYSSLDIEEINLDVDNAVHKLKNRIKNNS